MTTTTDEHCIWSPDVMPTMTGTCTEPRVEIMVEGATHDYYCREHREMLKIAHERRTAYLREHELPTTAMMGRRLTQSQRSRLDDPQTHPTCLLYTSPSPRDS